MQVNHKLNQVSVVHDFFSTLCSCILYIHVRMHIAQDEIILHRCTSSLAFPAPPLPRFPLTHSLFLTLLLAHPLATLNLRHSCTFCPSPSHTFSPLHTLTHSPRTAVTLFHMMHGIPKNENFSAQLSNLEDKTFIRASILSEPRPLL